MSAAPTRLLLIRHGETDWNALGLWQGTVDVALNERGRRQAWELAHRLAGEHIDAAYSSPLRRARETVDTVLRGRGIRTRVLPGLRELCYGLWQGRGPASRTRCAPGLERAWRERPWGVRFPGGETLEEVSARAVAAVDEIIRRHPGETVLIGGHGHLNRLILIHYRLLPRDAFWDITQPNGAVERIEAST